MTEHTVLTDGLCECGCGQATPLAPQGDKRKGWTRGKPVRFIRGHRPRGSASPLWKGGRVVRGDGYVGIYQPEHPRAGYTGYVVEHILVVEKCTGISVRRPMEVHHVNGDKTDNRPENLVVCPDKQYHHLLHRRQEAMAAGYPPHFRRCRYCHKWDAPSALQRHCYSMEHRECSMLASWRWRQAVKSRNAGAIQ